MNSPAVGMLAMAMLVAPCLSCAQDVTDNSTQNATGCLQKGAAASIYTLTDENGKTWDLRSKSVPLEPHVGHPIKVTCTLAKESKSTSDTTPQNNLLVTKLEMVRDSCKQP